MNPPTFRGLLEQLAADNTLRRVNRAVDPRHELVAVLRLTQKTTNDPILFTNVTGTKTPVATNIIGRRATLAAALGLASDQLIPALAGATRPPIAPITIQNAPVHDIVHTDSVDLLRDIPLIVHSELDAGAYISAGICIAADPATGTINASFNRIQLAGADHARVRMMPPQHLGQLQAAHERANQPMPLAVAIGAPPALMLAAASKIPITSDEYATAGGWQSTPLRVTPAKTIPLLVPADAEFIIEGHVLPHIREPEGPFGEFTDGYVAIGPNHVLKVTAITHRLDPIHHVILAGGTEDSVLLGVPLQTDVHKAIASHGDIADIGMPGHIFGCVIGLRKTHDDQPRAILAAALAAHPWMKLVVVVDDDVDVHDPNDVLWALHTRLTPDTGLFHLSNLPSFPRRDVAPVHHGKLGLDATVPMTLRSTFQRRAFPGSEAMKLDEYFD